MNCGFWFRKNIAFVISILALSEYSFAYNSAKCNAFCDKYSGGKNGYTNNVFAGAGMSYSSTTSFITSTGPCAAIGQREQRDVFIVRNTENIKIDSARGRGESINAVAELSGCSTESSIKLFCSKLQTNFESVFYNGLQDSSPEEIIKRIDKIILSTRGLKKVCKIKG